LRRWAVWAVVGSGLACAGLPFEPDPVPLRTELAGPEAEAARALAVDLVNGRFPSDVASACSDHGPTFVWLAGRHERSAVVAASLFAAAGCVAEVDPTDLAAVATRALESPDPMVLLSAFRAAEAVIVDLPPSDPLILALVGRTGDPNPVVVYEALTVLDKRVWTDEPLIAAAFLRALDADEAWLVTEALRRLRYRAKGLADPAPFVQTCLRLTGELDPGIRGRAALALARLAPEEPNVRDTLLRMLDDPHGFARSAAGEALGDMAYLPAIHAILPRIDDPSRNTWDMLKFTRLDGTSEVPHHVGSHFERVDDAWLRALVQLSEPLGDEAFVYREVNLRWRDLDIIAATRDAKKWYTEHQASIPDLP
jgi:hypothetical protein